MNRPFAMLFAALIAPVLPVQAQVSTFPSPPALPVNQTQSSSQNSNVSRSSGSGDSGSGDVVKSAPNGPAPVTGLTAATLTSMEALDDKAVMRDGDTISFRVIEDRDEPVTRVVTDTGEVDFPYIGRVKVEGKTCKQVATEVKKLLEVDYYKQATVIVGLDVDVWGPDKTKPKDMAWVVGEVRGEGPQELIKSQPMTVSQIILRAGGFSDFADQRSVKVIHRNPDSADAASNRPPDLDKVKDKDVQVVDVKSVFAGKSNYDPVVKSGDYIIVPKRFFNY